MSETKEVAAPQNHMLQQRMQLAAELGLRNQQIMIGKEIKVLEVLQKCTWPEVTPGEARNAMCPIEIVSFKQPVKWYQRIYGTDLRKCAFIEYSSMFGHNRCNDTEDHGHTKQLGLEMESVEGTGAQLPMAALLRLKEAKAKNFFESFQVWRPETASEAEARMLDPWLVGVVNGRYFKLCDWR